MIPKLLTALAVSMVFLSGSVTIVAAQDAYTQRTDAMKKMGAMAKTISDMLRGNTEFDADAANASIAAANAALADFGTYFPEGSDGGKSKAGPAIWEDPDGFAAAVSKVQADLAAAVAANPQTPEAVQTTFGMVAGNCKACHEKYQLPD